MPRNRPPRVFAALVCCAVCLAFGSLPAAALPGFESSLGLLFESSSWIVRLWQTVEQPFFALFAADATHPQGTTPPPPVAHSDAGITIDPDGVHGP